jgi:tripartite motif-containing protein 71
VSDRFQYLEIDDERVPRMARPGGPEETQSEETADGRPPTAGSDPGGRRSAVGGLPSSHPPGDTDGEWKVIEIIGSRGTAIGEFQSPGGIAVDRLGNLYVADSYNHRVQRITPPGDVTATGERGTRPGQFLNPQGIAVDDDLCFYVVEQGSHRVQAFTAVGEYLGSWGGLGSGPADLRSPMGIACVPSAGRPGGTRHLFVADTGNSRIVRLSGDQVRSGHRSAASLVLQHDAFRRPQGVSVDARGALYVADTFRHQVLRFDAGMRYLGPVGQPGDAPGHLSEPQDLAVDHAGRLYVVECAGHRLQVFACGGERGDEARLLQCISSVGRAGRLVAPGGVAVAPDGSIYVADTGNHRVLRLKENA